jgi:hypothetical protein
MIRLDEFRAENREIKDLCDILSLSMDEYSLHGNQVVCELIDRFVERVNAHLTHEDRSIYSDLLSNQSPEAARVAEYFLGNTQELRRIFNSYTRGWCRKPHNDVQRRKHVEESREMFKLVCDRITFEETRIFPLFEKKAG